MTDAPAIFEVHAGDHETARRRLVPSYDVFYGTAVAALAHHHLDKDHGFAVLAARRSG
jgi:hypothetical protein